jgi:predicted secreted protein
MLVGNSWAADVKSPSSLVTMTAANTDSKVELALGQELRVKLPAQLGTGFSWRADVQSTDTLALVASSVESDLSEPGGIETQVLIFKATKGGVGSLMLRYARPWEKDAPAAKTFVLHVTVRAKS